MRVDMHLVCLFHVGWKHSVFHVGYRGEIAEVVG